MIDLNFGHVPPQAREAEQAVLGACLLDKNAFPEVSEYLVPESFYVDAHKMIFKAMKQLASKSQPIDEITLVQQLSANEELEKIGGQYTLTNLTRSVVSSAHITAHARIIHEKFIKREQIRICGNALQSAYADNTDAFDNLDSLQGEVSKLAVSGVKTHVAHISDSLVERFQRLEALRHRPDHLTGVPSGFAPLDRLTAGWQDTDLIIIAARPSVGKTAFALNLARNASSHKTKPTNVAFFSLEMSKGQLTDRLMSAESGINLDLITRAKVDDELMQRLFETGVKPLANYGFYIDDTPALNIYELKAKIRRWLFDTKGENFLVIVDYLQLMSGIDGKAIKGGNREQEISHISRSLKATAKELKVPVIALSQLSRDIEKQKRDPQLSDLRESGAIEQDADMVLFLTRPDYQQIEIGDEVQNYADIHIKKHRNGDLAKIPMRTVLNVQRWMTNEEYERYERNLAYPNLSPLKVVNGNYETDNLF